MILLDIIVSLLTSGALIWLFREWISARLKASIQHEYDQKLEAHKAKLKAESEISILELKTALEREAALHAAAHASFSEGQKAAMERKLDAIDALWDTLLRFRNNLPPILTFIDILNVDEYREARNHPTFQALASELSGDEIMTIAEQFSGSVEKVRPYVGEYMWALFVSYQSIMLRLLYLLHLGLENAEKMEWHKDSGIKGVMAAVLTPEELNEFDRVGLGRVSWLKQRLEFKILSTSRKVISGEESGTESLEQAKIIQERAAQLETKNQKA